MVGQACGWNSGRGEKEKGIKLAGNRYTVLRNLKQVAKEEKTIARLLNTTFSHSLNLPTKGRQLIQLMATSHCTPFVIV